MQPNACAGAVGCASQPLQEARLCQRVYLNSAGRWGGEPWPLIGSLSNQIDGRVAAEWLRRWRRKRVRMQCTAKIPCLCSSSLV